eukprot:TRINITY_DN1350_c1_g2_i1.p1 TRINITY_DN1350_c1_g2~~TRINITY_DN1350_c1_g2_i1.p1  ORF type:complete len:953 (+),score=294.33 TRINITY_DN1350_c1_g2_i1:109-2967(+)
MPSKKRAPAKKKACTLGSSLKNLAGTRTSRGESPNGSDVEATFVPSPESGPGSPLSPVVNMRTTVSNGGGFLGVDENCSLLARKASINKQKARQISRKLSFNADDNVKACVRIRPFRDIEREPPVPSTVKVRGRSVNMMHNGNNHSFEFDHVFWSVSEDPDASSCDIEYSDQSTIFEAIGYRMLEHVFKGYNACIMAYGQTGSGKTYTMMGPDNSQAPHDRGLIPRTCEELFSRLQAEEKNLSDANIQRSYQIEVRYMEVYMEKVRDLLDPTEARKTLKVRKHPITGTFVDGLSCHEVKDWPSCLELINLGSQARAVASTKMNDVSSRSHAIFRITLTQTTRIADLQSTRMANLNLVDLAGSERVSRSGVMGTQLEEAAKVNLSLSTLRKVIDALLMKPVGGRRPLVPYRESVLTWVLSDSLGGNSRTMLLATVSPHFSNADETLSTLIYANRARRIINNVNINEDSTMEIMHELQSELAMLRQEHAVSALKIANEKDQARIQELEEAMELNEKALQEMEVQTQRLEAKYAGEVRVLRSAVEEKERKRIQLSEENRILEEEKLEVMTRRESLRIRYAQAMIANDEKLKSEQTAKERLEAAQDDLIKNLDKETKSRDLAEKKVDVMRNEVSTIKKKMTEFNVQWAHASTDIESWKRRAHMAEVEADDLGMQLAVSNKENRQLRAEVENLLEEVTLLRDAAGVTGSALKKVQSEKEEEVAKWKAKYDELALELDNERAALNKAKTAHVAMEEESIKSMERVGKLMGEMKQLKEKHLSENLQKDLEWKMKLEGEKDKYSGTRDAAVTQLEREIRRNEAEHQAALEKERANCVKLKAEYAEDVKNIEAKYAALNQSLPVLQRLHDHIFEMAQSANDSSYADPTGYTAEHLRLVNAILRFDSTLKSAPVPLYLSPQPLSSAYSSPSPRRSSSTANHAFPIGPPKLSFCKFGGNVNRD